MDQVSRRLIRSIAADPGVPEGQRDRAQALLDRHPQHRRQLGQRGRLPRKKLRAAIMARDRVCTAGEGLGDHSGHLEWDHQWGRGKGRPPETLENGRALCEGHHHRRTGNEPSRIAWHLDFRRHALELGYLDEVAAADRAIALERGQHPEPQED